MNRPFYCRVIWACALLLAANVVWADRYERDELAPIEAYLADREADEIVIARSAAPAHVSDGATVLVLRTSGYQEVRNTCIRISADGFLTL